MGRSSGYVLKIHRFIIQQFRQKSFLLKLFLNGVEDFFAFCVYGVIMITGGYIFQKAGFAGAKFVHIILDIPAGFNSHASPDDSIYFVIDEYITDLSTGIYDGV